MSMTDPIADMLTRIRNANMVKKTTVEVPFSKLKANLIELVKQEKFIKEYKVQGEGKDKKIVITLKYGENNAKAINGLKKISKPGLRVYVTKEEIPYVLNGMGIAIISTSKGMLTDKLAREHQIGGEVLAYVW